MISKTTVDVLTAALGAGLLLATVVIAEPPDGAGEPATAVADKLAAASEPQRFELLIVAPVPVGHRIEISWYSEVVTGLLSGERHDSHPHRPVIRDLDTGIVYGPIEVFWPRGSIYAAPTQAPASLTRDPHPGCALERSLTGRVLECRVATYGRNDSYSVQTTLLVEPDSGGTG